jgi:hypothetical protein
LFQFNVPYHGFPLKLCFFWQVEEFQANDTPASSTKRKWTENLAVGIGSLRIKSLDYALLENRIFVSLFGRGEG